MPADHPVPLLSEGERSELRQCVLVVRSSMRLLRSHGREHPVQFCDSCKRALAEIDRVTSEMEAISR